MESDTNPIYIYDMLIEQLSKLRDTGLLFPQEDEFSKKENQHIELSHENYDSIIDTMVELYNQCIDYAQPNAFTEILRRFQRECCERSTYTINIDIANNSMTLKHEFWYYIEITINYHKENNIFVVTNYYYYSVNGRGGMDAISGKIGPFSADEIYDILEHIVYDDKCWFIEKYKNLLWDPNNI